eukprot:TRINITY_DN22197_c0_g2_i1.p2 TRINITY_DN22197_c0_g2~~TRINITY_DN22197_c0_g2_i1.p2  ORF type:complete len:363 (+),score=75.87 TRINITY_DN22197_c0_g2_i1:379-1467(+)
MGSLTHPLSLIKAYRWVSGCDVDPALRRSVVRRMERIGWAGGSTPRRNQLISGLKVTARIRSRLNQHTLKQLVGWWSWMCRSERMLLLQATADMAEAVLCELDGPQDSISNSNNGGKQMAVRSLAHAWAREGQAQMQRVVVSWKINKRGMAKTRETERWKAHFMSLKQQNTRLEQQAAAVVAVHVLSTQCVWRWKTAAVHCRLQKQTQGWNWLMLQNSIELFKVSAEARAIRCWCCNAATGSLVRMSRRAQGWSLSGLGRVLDRWLASSIRGQLLRWRMSVLTPVPASSSVDWAGYKRAWSEGSTGTTSGETDRLPAAIKQAARQIIETTCLLYTSDAADEEDSVDLGGRRIIKKKNKRRKE